MKVIFTILIMAISLGANAQSDVLKAGVYNLDNNKTIHIRGVEKRTIISGKTLDLQKFEIATFTISAGKVYTQPIIDSQFEQLIVVKSGNVTLTINDTTKTVAAYSIALILAGDKISFKNNANEPATFYIIKYKSTNTADIKRGHDAGPSVIKDWSLLKVNKSTKGETRAIFDRPTSMFGRFDVHATALNPGFASHDPHTHRVEELILMLNGSVQETIAQDKFDAHAGDCIYLSSGILHGPKNISNEQCYYLAIQWHNLKTD
ncbi:cupin domain-containing protein [Mucilaginibacter sp.]|uniref:cupin domain-containing protein n=1 Tax=Mucilaginibacter sp. TaxID=1882438 RepID=UPI00261E4071|nr:cupin domain-containing protein [Mucilaginibacter sp.]MDB5031252.1 hypothetical protein [Mucilaginibacter sp.]